MPSRGRPLAGAGTWQAGALAPRTLPRSGRTRAARVQVLEYTQAPRRVASQAAGAAAGPARRVGGAPDALRCSPLGIPELPKLLAVLSSHLSHLSHTDRLRMQVLEYNVALKRVAGQRLIQVLDLHGALAARLRQRAKPPYCFRPALVRTRARVGFHNGLVQEDRKRPTPPHRIWPASHMYLRLLR